MPAMSTPTIRRACAADADAFLSLIDALADFESLARPDAAARERLVRDGLGERPRIDVFLAEADGRAVGYTIMLETYSSFLALPTLYLEDVFVLEAYRGKGVGKALFLHYLGEAQRRGCGRAEWQVLDWNTAAQGFYERWGAKRMREWWPYRMTRDEVDRALEGSVPARGVGGTSGD